MSSSFLKSILRCGSSCNVPSSGWCNRSSTRALACLAWTGGCARGWQVQKGLCQAAAQESFSRTCQGLDPESSTGKTQALAKQNVGGIQPPMTASRKTSPSPSLAVGWEGHPANNTQPGPPQRLPAKLSQVFQGPRARSSFCSSGKVQHLPELMMVSGSAPGSRLARLMVRPATSVQYIIFSLHS